MEVSGFVLLVLDVPEMSQDDLISPGEIADGVGGERTHLILGRWTIGEVEAGAGVGRDRSGVLMRPDRAVGQHRGV